MKGTPRKNTLLIGIGFMTLAAAAFGGWWLQDVRVEASWNPEWPRTVRITGESVETIVAAGSGEITEGDRARAAERAHWKAYYYAQLRAAEQLGSLGISAQTSIRELAEMDQELRASFEGTLRAAAEVDSFVEHLDDSVRARVTVEIPAERLRGLRAMIAEALRAGRVSIERRPRSPEPEAIEASAPPAPAEGSEQPSAPPAPAEDSEQASVPGAPVEEKEQASVPSTPFEEAPKPVEIALPAPPPLAVHRPPRPAPSFTGAAVHLGEQPYRLGVTSVLYELGGTEVGTVLDLPPERLTAGFFPIADSGDDDAVHRLAGDSPRDLEATISGRDLFLTERLSAEEVRQLQQWLRAGKIVLVLG